MWFLKRKPTILVLAPKCGGYKTLFSETQRAIEVAREILDGNTSLDVEYENSGCSKKEVCVKSEILLKRKYSGIIATLLSGHVGCLIAAADSYSIPLVLTISSTPNLLVSSNYTLRVCFSDEKQGMAAADFIATTLGESLVGIFTDIDLRYTAVISAEFRKRFVGLGGTVEPFFQRKGRFCFEPQMKLAVSRGVKTFFIAASPGKVLELVRLGKSIGQNLRFVTTDWTAALEMSDSEISEELYFTTHYHPHANPTPFSEVFFGRYVRKFGKKPSFAAALSFDAYLVLKGLLEEYGDKIPEVFLDKKRVFGGVTGHLIYNGSGDPIKDVVVVQFRKGEEVFVRSVRV